MRSFTMVAGAESTTTLMYISSMAFMTVSADWIGFHMDVRQIDKKKYNRQIVLTILFLYNERINDVTQFLNR